MHSDDGEEVDTEEEFSFPEHFVNPQAAAAASAAAARVPSTATIAAQKPWEKHTAEVVGGAIYLSHIHLYVNCAHSSVVTQSSECGSEEQVRSA